MTLAQLIIAIDIAIRDYGIDSPIVTNLIIRRDNLRKALAEAEMC